MPDRTLQIIMKRNYPKLLLLVLGMTALQGCIAFPPLIQVEHKENADPNRRLDDIERRLERIEKKLDQK